MCAGGFSFFFYAEYQPTHLPVALPLFTVQTAEEGSAPRPEPSWEGIIKSACVCGCVCVGVGVGVCGCGCL